MQRTGAKPPGCSITGLGGWGARGPIRPRPGALGPLRYFLQGTRPLSVYFNAYAVPACGLWALKCFRPYVLRWFLFWLSWPYVMSHFIIAYYPEPSGIPEVPPRPIFGHQLALQLVTPLGRLLPHISLSLYPVPGRDHIDHISRPCPGHMVLMRILMEC